MKESDDGEDVDIDVSEDDHNTTASPRVSSPCEESSERGDLSPHRDYHPRHEEPADQLPLKENEKTSLPVKEEMVDVVGNEDEPMKRDLEEETKLPEGKTSPRVPTGSPHSPRLPTPPKKEQSQSKSKFILISKYPFLVL